MTENKKFIYLWFDEQFRDKIIDEKIGENGSFLVAWLCSVVSTGKILNAETRFNEFLEYHKNNEMMKVLDIIDDWKDETDGWSCFCD